jgi:hypothetical protein
MKGKMLTVICQRDVFIMAFGLLLPEGYKYRVTGVVDGCSTDTCHYRVLGERMVFEFKIHKGRPFDPFLYLNINSLRTSKLSGFHFNAGIITLP